MGPESSGDEQKLGQTNEYTLNWNRAIHIDRLIDDALVRELTPVILRMKQESSEPITVGIDSPGGSIASVDAILGLLNSPDQDGKTTYIITAVTNRAYSAAASLLALGDYSVAFPNSKILYHDLRYSEMEDITPAKALDTARALERRNSAFALRLANHILRRIIWVFMDLSESFTEARNRSDSFTKQWDEYFKEILPKGADETIDLVGFSLALFDRLSVPVDQEIAIRALRLLNSWMQIEKIERRLFENSTERGKSLDIVDGINKLVAEIRAMGAVEDVPTKLSESELPIGLDQEAHKDIRLFLEVLARHFAVGKNLSLSGGGLDAIVQEFSLLKEINSEQYLRTIAEMLIEHDYFFSEGLARKIKNAKDDDERNQLLAPVYPQARTLWYYTVLICRCLMQGDHFLTPGDAQLFGLVDEVIGGGPVESVREWRKRNAGTEAA